MKVRYDSATRTFLVDEDTMVAIEEACEATGKTFDELVRAALAEYLRAPGEEIEE